MRTVSVNYDFDRWRDFARALLDGRVPPTEVLWTDDDHTLFYRILKRSGAT